MPLIGFLFGEKGDPDGQCDLVKHTDCQSEQNGHPLGGRFAWESVSFGKNGLPRQCAHWLAMTGLGGFGTGSPWRHPSFAGVPGLP